MDVGVTSVLVRLPVPTDVVLDRDVRGRLLIPGLAYIRLSCVTLDGCGCDQCIGEATRAYRRSTRQGCEG